MKSNSTCHHDQAASLWQPSWMSAITRNNEKGSKMHQLYALTCFQQKWKCHHEKKSFKGKKACWHCPKSEKVNQWKLKMSNFCLKKLRVFETTREEPPFYLIESKFWLKTTQSKNKQEFKTETSSQRSPGVFPPVVK